MIPVEITLSYPISADGQKIKVLKMRRASVGDQLAAANNGKTQAEQEIILMANLVGLSPDDIRKLDLKDYAKLQDQFRDFLS